MESKKVGGCYDQPKEKGFKFSIFSLKGNLEIQAFSVLDSFAGRNVLAGVLRYRHI